MRLRIASIEGPRTVLLLTLILFVPAFALLSTAQAGFFLSYEGEPVPWDGLLRARLADGYIYALFLPALYLIALRFPMERRRWPISLPVHFAASLVFAVVKEALFVTVGNWFRPGLFVLRDILAEDYFSEVAFFWALMGLTHLFAVRLGARLETHGADAQPPHRPAPFRVKDRSGYRLVGAEDVDWIEAQGNYALLDTCHGRWLVRETMAALERRLGSGFLRVHRRAIVNLARVERIETRTHGEYVIVLECGKRINTGRAYNQAVRRLLA